MDRLTQLYERLRAQAPVGAEPAEPPSFEEWLKYWNDNETEIGNLRSFEHWMSRQIKTAGAAAPI